uniref:TOG domain-containing protein n=1 Tax=Triticum aestivum TaxID=4565 RepID=A0A3B6U5I4_WHEAT
MEAARAKDTKERLAGVERLHEALDAAARRGLSPAEVTSLVDTCVDLTRDANFRVAQGGLQALSAAAVLAGDHFKIHLNALVPAAVERLGDGKQPVREAARQLLVTLMEVSSPTIILERAGNYAWTHKSWRVREEFVLTVATAVGLFASTELLMQRVLLSPVLQLMNDSNQSVREAAISCIELKEINSRLNRIEPKVPASDGTATQHKVAASRSVSVNPKRGSPRTKSTPRESTLFGGNLIGEVQDSLAKEAEKDKQIASEEEEEEEYVLLELDDVHYSCIQPNAPYILSGLDTLTPTLVVGDSLKMIGEYEETVGPCYLFSESDAPPKPVHEEPAPPKENKDKQGRNIKEVKHVTSVHKMLKFRSTGEGRQEHRAYRYRDKEF